MSAPPAPEATPAQRRAVAWSRLRTALFIRPTRTALLAGVLALLLGLALTVQIRATREQGLEALREDELVGVLDTVEQRRARLSEEVADLERQREDLVTAPAGSEAARRAAQDRADDLAVLAGTVPARGPGVTMTLEGPPQGIGTGVYLDLFAELRDAGAEAIQVGPVRVVASSAVTESADGVVSLDGTPLPARVVVSAIGEPRTLASAMDIPGGLVETVRGLEGRVSVTTSPSVLVSAVRTTSTLR
ncbi:DUF881 domain-containing protein [Agilicoccus flavus]|uniref:DUF881 domain-containing protein n=1 Tax=Agilicoccus flavus TaxID=2775968 RepID=UPI001CF6C6FE|nr:DUF881 domain-containing protein [Agilicoccus flavus]